MSFCLVFRTLPAVLRDQLVVPGIKPRPLAYEMCTPARSAISLGLYQLCCRSETQPFPSLPATKAVVGPSPVVGTPHPLPAFVLCFVLKAGLPLSISSCFASAGLLPCQASALAFLLAGLPCLGDIIRAPWGPSGAVRCSLLVPHCMRAKTSVPDTCASPAPRGKSEWRQHHGTG